MFPDLPHGVTVHVPEGDAEYVALLHDFLVREYGARFDEDKTYGPVGSQVINVWPFAIGDARLQILEETYMGIQLQGPKELVDGIVAALKLNGLSGER
jgi:hypothetical protein